MSGPDIKGRLRTGYFVFGILIAIKVAEYFVALEFAIHKPDKQVLPGSAPTICNYRRNSPGILTRR